MVAGACGEQLAAGRPGARATQGRRRPGCEAARRRQQMAKLTARLYARRGSPSLMRHASSSITMLTRLDRLRALALRRCVTVPHVSGIRKPWVERSHPHGVDDAAIRGRGATSLQTE